MPKSHEDLIRKYFEKHPLYLRLARNIESSIEQFLKENSINYAYTSSRVKKLEDFLEKVERKKYKKPFKETEDMCGIRVVCYFCSDIERIGKILEEEFEVIEMSKKEDGNVPTQFGYRSRHYIAKIKKDWAKTPNYKYLCSLKFEIQVRTVLMHAWAEIEHKLAYKKFEHMPAQFRRKFSRISAKLEEADEQFEEIMRDIKSYKKEAKSKKVLESQINLDSLVSILEERYPKKHRSINEVRDVLDQLIDAGVSAGELDMALSADKEGEEEKKMLEGVVKNKVGK